MRTRSTILRHRRAVVLLLALTWLPYVSTRCLADAHGGCGMMAMSHESPAAHPTDSDHSGSATHDHSEHHSTPARTCCELTGKCDVAISATISTVDAAPVVAIVPAITRAPVRSEPERLGDPIRTLAHAPPLYLRNATLRI